MANKGHRHKLRLDLAYLGTAYCGWQPQPALPEARSVFDAVHEAVAAAGHPYGPVAAGRTDKGVHAAHQVVSLKTQREHTPEQLQLLAQQIAAGLPTDIRLLRLTQVPAAFHAINAVRHKRYSYLVLSGACGSPAGPAERVSYALGCRLELPLVRAASELFVGRHNFRAFSSAKGHKDCTRLVRAVRVLDEGAAVELPFLGLLEAGVEPGGATRRFVRFVVEGEGFLKHQVRRMVGALLLVGSGVLQEADLAGALEEPTAAAWGPSQSAKIGVRRLTAPAHGLWLERVECHGDPAEEDEDQGSCAEQVTSEETAIANHVANYDDFIQTKLIAS